MSVVRSKICGITRIEDALIAAEAGADAIGLVFYAKSPRAVSIQQARDIVAALPAFVTTVGLFVNASREELSDVLAGVALDLLQFHGDETPTQCEAAGRPYLRAARMASGFDLLDFTLSCASAQAILVDAHVEGYGGGGQVFDWSLLPRQLPRPMILSGGLHPGNVAEGVRMVRPWAVDVSSGVEVGKGLKDAELMRQFCQAVREADRSCTEAA